MVVMVPILGAPNYGPLFIGKTFKYIELPPCPVSPDAPEPRSEAPECVFQVLKAKASTSDLKFLANHAILALFFYQLNTVET